MCMGYVSDSYCKIFLVKNYIGQIVKDNIVEYKWCFFVWYVEKLKDLLFIYINISDDDVNVVEVELMICVLKVEGKKFEYKIFECVFGVYSFDWLDIYELSKICLDIYKFMGCYLKFNKLFGLVKELCKVVYKF